MFSLQWLPYLSVTCERASLNCSFVEILCILFIYLFIHLFTLILYLCIIYLMYVCMYVFICFLEPHLWHREILGQGQNQSHSCWHMPQPQQFRFLAMSGAYTTAQGNAGSPTHRARPGIEPVSSWILVGFLWDVPQWEIQKFCVF